MLGRFLLQLCLLDLEWGAPSAFTPATPRSTSPFQDACEQQKFSLGTRAGRAASCCSCRCWTWSAVRCRRRWRPPRRSPTRWSCSARTPGRPRCATTPRTRCRSWRPRARCWPACRRPWARTTCARSGARTTRATATRSTRTSGRARCCSSPARAAASETPWNPLGRAPITLISHLLSGGRPGEHVFLAPRFVGG